MHGGGSALSTFRQRWSVRRSPTAAHHNSDIPNPAKQGYDWLRLITRRVDQERYGVCSADVIIEGASTDCTSSAPRLQGRSRYDDNKRQPNQEDSSKRKFSHRVRILLVGRHWWPGPEATWVQRGGLMAPHIGTSISSDATGISLPAIRLRSRAARSLRRHASAPWRWRYSGLLPWPAGSLGTTSRCPDESLKRCACTIVLSVPNDRAHTSGFLAAGLHRFILRELCFRSVQACLGHLLPLVDPRALQDRNN